MKESNDKKDNNKKQSILYKEIKVNKIALIVSIAVALMTMFIIFMGCVFNTTKKVCEDMYGPFHAEVVLEDKELYKKISKNALVRDVGYISVKHYFRCNDNVVTYDRGSIDGVGVGSLNKDVLKLYKVEISKGRLPKNDKEIILSEYFDIGQGTINVGDSIELGKGDLVDTYKVVGLYRDMLRVHQYNEEENLIDRVTALTYDEEAKIEDNSVVYVRCFNVINLDPYTMLEKIGVKGDIYTNTDLIDILDVREILTGYQYGREYLIGQVLIVVVLLIISSIILCIGFVREVRINLNKEDIADTLDNEKKKYVKKMVNNLLGFNVIKGVGVGYIVAIIINVLVSLCFGEIILKPILWNVKLEFTLSIPALIISFVLNTIVIGLAYNYLMYKITGIYQLSKEKKTGRTKVVCLVRIALVFVVTLIIAITIDRKFKVPLNEHVNWLKSENINYDISISKQCEVDLFDETISEAEKDAAKIKLARMYKKVKEDIGSLPMDMIKARAFNEDAIAYIEEFNPELEKAYEKAYIEPSAISNDVALYKIYLDDKDYKKIVEDNKLDKNKYIGKSNPPAIVVNSRRVYTDSYEYIEVKILNESQKELIINNETIEIGDLISNYNINVEYGIIPFESYDYLYLYYPESSMKGIDSFVIDIYAKDYEKLNGEFNTWLEKNSDLEILSSTPTAEVNELKEEYMSKKIVIWGIFVAINLVVILINMIRFRKK